MFHRFVSGVTLDKKEGERGRSLNPINLGKGFPSNQKSYLLKDFDTKLTDLPFRFYIKYQ